MLYLGQERGSGDFCFPLLFLSLAFPRSSLFKQLSTFMLCPHLGLWQSQFLPKGVWKMWAWHGCETLAWDPSACISFIPSFFWPLGLGFCQCFCDLYLILFFSYEWNFILNSSLVDQSHTNSPRMHCLPREGSCCFPPHLSIWVLVSCLGLFK